MICCVEDDAGIRNMMLYTLRAAGFEAEGFADGEAFFAALDRNRPELVLLDVMLPGEDGILILQKLRARKDTARLPVIMATARGTEYDKVMGLDLGADDYLAKPFGMMEMLSRVKAVLRRSQPEQTPPEQLRMGRLCLDSGEHSVSLDGQRLNLTLKEHELLQLLMSHPGRAFTREQLLEAVWDADYLGESRTVDVHIATLRTKLGPCGEYIRTVRGVGYRMEDCT